MAGYLIGGLAFIYGWWRTPLYIPSFSNFDFPKVSVIIAARNEEDTIPLILKDLLMQDYPKDLLEIIVIDDHSTDNTTLQVLEFNDSQIHLIRLNESEPLNSYKKKAISKGIDQSTGDFILTTDADCRMGRHWVRTMAQFYIEGKYKMVSAGVAFLDKGNFFQRFQSMEFSILIGLGAASIRNGYPFTCNGANLGYSKSVFYELGGFSGIDNLASGDDELLLHKVSSHYPGEIGFVKSKEALVYTHAKENIQDFVKQRKRWASKSLKYKNRKMILVSVIAFFFNIFTLINLILVWFIPELRILLIIQILVKGILELFLMGPILKFMGQLDFLLKSIFLLPFYFWAYTYYIVFVGLSGNTGKYEWKGRMVH